MTDSTQRSDALLKRLTCDLAIIRAEIGVVRAETRVRLAQSEIALADWKLMPLLWASAARRVLSEIEVARHKPQADGPRRSAAVVSDCSWIRPSIFSSARSSSRLASLSSVRTHSSNDSVVALMLSQIKHAGQLANHTEFVRGIINGVLFAVPLWAAIIGALLWL